MRTQEKMTGHELHPNDHTCNSTLIRPPTERVPICRALLQRRIDLASGEFIRFRWLCFPPFISVVNFRDDLSVSTHIFPTKKFSGSCSDLGACSNCHPDKGVGSGPTAQNLFIGKLSSHFLTGPVKMLQC